MNKIFGEVSKVIRRLVTSDINMTRGSNETAHIFFVQMETMN